MKLMIYFQFFVLNQIYLILINGEQTICSNQPLFELVEDCEAYNSISNYKIQTSDKIVNKTLNGQVQILLNDCSMRDALKLKKCISIASIIKR